MTAGCDGAVGRRGGIDESEKFRRRGGSIGIDESDEVTVAPCERLRDRASLAQLRQVEQADPSVVTGMIPDYLSGCIAGSVECNQEARLRVSDLAAIGVEGAPDAAFLVVSRDHDVDAHSFLLLSRARN